MEALAYLSPMVIALVGKNLCETRGSSGDGGASVARGIPYFRGPNRRRRFRRTAPAAPPR